jgi:hypothetical protein
MSHQRRERIGLAATLVVALGSACSSDGNGSGQGPITNTGAAPGAGGQSANAAGSGNSAGQPGMTAQGGSGQPGGGTANGGAAGSAGSAGTSTANGGAAGSGGGVGGGAAGMAASSGGAPSGGAATLPDGGTCCATADCQPQDVKTCVCTQWQQSQCCSGTWDTFCQTTAEEKCNAEKCVTTTVPPEPTPDGGHIVKGACCAVHATPGCDDTPTEQCICKLLGDCCTKQWDSVCVQLVREKHCEDGVRDCVCTTWQQQSCCDTSWTMACSLVATSKCGAQPACP